MCSTQAPSRSEEDSPRAQKKIKDSFRESFLFSYKNVFLQKYDTIGERYIFQ